MVGYERVDVARRDDEQASCARVGRREQSKLVTVPDHARSHRKCVHGRRPQSRLSRVRRRVAGRADWHAERAAPRRGDLGQRHRLRCDIPVGKGIVRLFTLGWEDPDRLQPVPQRHLESPEEIGVHRVAEERHPGHPGAVTILVEATGADHGVEVLRRQRFLKEDMCPGDACVQMTNSGL